MKKSSLRNLGVMAVVLCLVTTCLLGGTLAKYTSTVNGSATFTAAKWSFKANGNDGSVAENKFVVDIGSTAYDSKTLKTGVIAPGSTGVFNIELDGTGSEVGIEYTIAMTSLVTSDVPKGLKFSIDGTNYNYDITTPITDTIDYSEAENAMKKSVPVYWKWDEDNTDTSYNGKNIVLNIAVTGTQVAPAETTAP